MKHLLFKKVDFLIEIKKYVLIWIIFAFSIFFEFKQHFKVTVFFSSLIFKIGQVVQTYELSLPKFE